MGISPQVFGDAAAAGLSRMRSRLILINLPGNYGAVAPKT
jgi:hypothetical protein